MKEDGLTILWKAVKHSESFAEIVGDLKRLRLRLDRNLYAKKLSEFDALKTAATEAGVDIAATDEPDPEESAVKVVYVDNCCNVKLVVLRAFPGCLVRLDVFHWLKRWNDVLNEPGSLHAGVFRALMSRAVFTVEQQEYMAAKQRVTEKLRSSRKQVDREPTVQEIIAEARTTIPMPDILRRRVEDLCAAVLPSQGRTNELVVVDTKGR